MKKKLSECCEAPVIIRHCSSWISNPKYKCTHWYECSACGQPTDTIEKEGGGMKMLPYVLYLIGSLFFVAGSIVTIVRMMK